MAYHLADGTEYKDGLEVTRTGDCPDNKWAYELVRGQIVPGSFRLQNEVPFCQVYFDDVTGELGLADAGETHLCRLEYLQTVNAVNVDFDEGDFLNLVGGEQHETC